MFSFNTQLVSDYCKRRRRVADRGAEAETVSREVAVLITDHQHTLSYSLQRNLLINLCDTFFSDCAMLLFVSLALLKVISRIPISM